MHLYWVKYDASKLRNSYTVGNVLKSSETFSMGIFETLLYLCQFFPKTCNGSKCAIFGQQSILKIEILRISKTRLDLECFSSTMDYLNNPWFNKYTICKMFLQHKCLLSAGLEHSRSNLVFKQSRLRDNFIFGMLHAK